MKRPGDYKIQALINLLIKKGLIDEIELGNEIYKLRKTDWEERNK